MKKMRFFPAAIFSLVVIASKITASGATGAGRLIIPTEPPKETAGVGLVKLGRTGLLYVPPSYRANEPLPLLVLLHRAAGTCSEWFSAGPNGAYGLYAAHADQDRFIILAPEAPGQTWGSGGPKRFGTDHVAINHALEAAFARCAIDRHRLAIGGFSDGASYALSLGLANGDLFGSIIAFSPGYIVRAPGRNKPLLFIAHGGADPVLPAGTSSRIFVASLRKNGYTIDFREFGGGHNVPPAVAEQAMAWLSARFRQR
jgi:phospholipase/carboxylesterase